MGPDSEAPPYDRTARTCCGYDGSGPSQPVTEQADGVDWLWPTTSVPVAATRRFCSHPMFGRPTTQHLTSANAASSPLGGSLLLDASPYGMRSTSWSPEAATSTLTRTVADSGWGLSVRIAVLELIPVRLGIAASWSDTSRMGVLECG
jgi:hypothetical protein